MGNLTINSRQAFLEYLETNPVKGDAHPEVPFYKTHNILPNEYFSLTMLQISFELYTNFLLFKHPETNELYLAEMNDGGITTTFTIVKVYRDDILNKQALLNDWGYIDNRYLKRYS